MANDRTYGPLRQTLADLQQSFQPHVMRGLAAHIADLLAKKGADAYEPRLYGLGGTTTLDPLRSSAQPMVVQDLANHVHELVEAHRAAKAAAEEAALAAMSLALAEEDKASAANAEGFVQAVEALAEAAEEGVEVAIVPSADEGTELAEHDAETSPGTEVDALQVAIAHAREAAKEDVQLQDDDTVEGA